jgi:hypothetical protein
MAHKNKNITQDKVYLTQTQNVYAYWLPLSSMFYFFAGIVFLIVSNSKKKI